jgi:hypothetical protein
MCNLFSAKAEGSEQQPKLFGLSEWADGSAGSALKDWLWVLMVAQALLSRTDSSRAAKQQAAAAIEVVAV